MQQFNTKLLLSAVQTKINALLNYDKHTQKKLSMLAGKTIVIILQNIDLTVYIDFEQDYFYLDTEKTRDPILTLKGTPTAFFRMMQQSGTYSVTQAIQVEGDLHIAQTLQAAMRDLNIDWVEIIAPYTGDIIADGIDKSLRGVHNWWQSTRIALWENTADYVQDEAQLVVSKAEVENFVEGVFALRQTLDRLSLRIARIKQQVE